jgi:hypothetical protein
MDNKKTMLVFVDEEASRIDKNSSPACALGQCGLNSTVQGLRSSFRSYVAEKENRDGQLFWDMRNDIREMKIGNDKIIEAICGTPLSPKGVLQRTESNEISIEVIKASILDLQKKSHGYKQNTKDDGSKKTPSKLQVAWDKHGTITAFGAGVGGCLIAIGQAIWSHFSK